MSILRPVGVRGGGRAVGGELCMGSEMGSASCGHFRGVDGAGGNSSGALSVVLWGRVVVLWSRVVMIGGGVVRIGSRVVFRLLGIWVQTGDFVDAGISFRISGEMGGFSSGYVRGVLGVAVWAQDSLGRLEIKI